jgi:hypothetical protein
MGRHGKPRGGEFPSLHGATSTDTLNRLAVLEHLFHIFSDDALLHTYLAINLHT